MPSIGRTNLVPTAVLCPDGVSKHEPSCEPVLKTAQANPKDLPIKKKPVAYSVVLGRTQRKDIDGPKCCFRCGKIGHFVRFCTEPASVAVANYELSATNRKFDLGRKLTSTKFAPGFQINLTSVGELTAQGFKVLF